MCEETDSGSRCGAGAYDQLYTYDSLGRLAAATEKTGTTTTGTWSYAYTVDNPINHIDPTGYITFSVSGCAGYFIDVCVNVSIDDSGHIGAGGGNGFGFGGDVSATASNGDVTSGLSGGASGCLEGYCGGISGSPDSSSPTYSGAWGSATVFSLPSEANIASTVRRKVSH